MGTSGENVIAALLASRAWGRVIDHRADGKGWKRTVEMQVASSLKDLNLVHDFSVEDLVVGKTAGTGIFEVRVRRTPNGPWTLLSEVGFGVSQVLPVLVLCYYVPAGSTVLLEQPELHLHPSVQAALADVLVSAMRIGNIQILVESHSEHFLLRLQRRIAEEAVSPEDLALYFCHGRDGESRSERLRVDEYGTIGNWPDGCFGDSFGEVAERTLKVQERRTAP